ncbi:hypothetical protein [Clostridium botulinum]|uniref:hypothetical protein n=1 Tax=Clostridium botulinum TaxID=1491 RepID=UPI001FD6B1FE|nr:hypothetical protein [Clostridium botulinum]MCJ8173234.1 hypothetical protein [Clostridium botulinum]
MKLDRHVGQSLMDIKINNKKVTKEISQSVISDFNQMSDQLKGAIDKRYNESYQTMQTFMSKKSGLKAEENQQILQKIREKQEAEKNIVQQGQQRIDEIVNQASQNHKKLTTQQLNEINTIRNNMTETAVQNISKSAEEQRVILEKLNFDSGNLTAQQAAKVVENSAKARDGSIQAAEEQYNRIVAEIIHQRDDLGIITSDQANQMLDAASQQKENAVTKAQEMHTEVVSHAQQQAGEHVTQVDWETGKVLDNFDAMINKIHEFNALSIKEKVITITKKINNVFEKKNDNGMDTYNGPGSIAGAGKAYATGTNYATSGVHEVAEHGVEIILNRQYRKFSGGEKVLNNKKSKKFLGSMLNSNNATEEKPSPYFAVAQPQLAGSGGPNINIDVDVENNFDNDADIDGIVQEAMKKFGYKLKEALKNIKK